MKFIIYGLIDPRTKELRYIGMSSNGLKRPKAHLYPSIYNKSNTYVYCWIKNLKKENLQPEIMVIDECSNYTDLQDLEVFYINYFKAIGCNLTNLREGGLGGKYGEKQSPEAIAKRIATKKANNKPPHKMSKESRLKVSLAQIGLIRGPSSEYTKLKISFTNRGANNGMYGKIPVNRKPIVDQFGTAYPSIRSAAKMHGLEESNIYKTLIGERKHTKGFTFKYIEVLNVG